MHCLGLDGYLAVEDDGGFAVVSVVTGTEVILTEVWADIIKTHELPGG